MFKSTMNFGVPATFNIGLLFDSLSKNKTEQTKFLDFLKSKNIRDYRVGANESTNKGQSFCDLSFDLVHHLFNSINFHQLFGTQDEQVLINKKINIYNEIVHHLKLNMFDEYRDAAIKDSREYNHKLRVYMGPLVERSVQLHKNTDEFATAGEGAQNFWYLVDHCIFTNVIKHELEQLKTFRANV